MPSAGGFKWAQNPFPNYGYWLLYEQGTLSKGITYMGHHFIKDAYNEIFGTSANRMITATGAGDIKFSASFLNKFNRYITNEINSRMKV